MCLFNMPDAPKPPPPPAPPPPPEPVQKSVDPDVQKARDSQRDKAIATQGREGTMLTKGLLDDDELSTKKQTLLGS